MSDLYTDFCAKLNVCIATSQPRPCHGHANHIRGITAGSPWPPAVSVLAKIYTSR